MILVDTSVWIEHLRQGDPELVRVLEHGEALVHPFVLGELALGSLRDGSVLEALSGLPKIAAASDDAVLDFISSNALSGSGIGYVDAHLLAAAALNGAAIITRDRRLKSVADRLGLSGHPA